MFQNVVYTLINAQEDSDNMLLHALEHISLLHASKRRRDWVKEV